jgi:hypothetical protein
MSTQFDPVLNDHLWTIVKRLGKGYSEAEVVEFLAEYHVAASQADQVELLERIVASIGDANPTEFQVDGRVRDELAALRKGAK